VFGLPDGYFGTSMAAPHVSAAAALVIASGVLGPHPTSRRSSPGSSRRRRPLGPAARTISEYFGAGLLNAAAATIGSPTGSTGATAERLGSRPGQRDPTGTTGDPALALAARPRA
jgi:subtilisin family serine protease